MGTQQQHENKMVAITSWSDMKHKQTHLAQFDDAPLAPTIPKVEAVLIITPFHKATIRFYS
jgi:hypothetical protein